jgi:predicted metalloprotease
MKRASAVIACLIAAPLVIAQPAKSLSAAEINSKVASARQFFDQVWGEFFRQAGVKYESPRAVPYSGLGDSPCGKLIPGNAGFCPQTNTIYYDQEFLVAETKTIGAAVNSDGDYAAIAIIAHEWGHAAHYWLAQSKGYVNSSLGSSGGAPLWSTLNRENIADCFAGAVTRAAQAAGRLDPNDIAEGEREILSGGDPPEKRPTSLKDIFAPLSGHGDPQTRLRLFREGLRGGAKVCVILPGSR